MFLLPLICMFSPRGNAVNLSDIQVNLPKSYNFLEEYPECDFGPLQQECGSCYAYGALKAMSHRFCRQTHKKVVLSSQYVIACDISDNGCSGGCERSVFYFFEQHGITDRECHPHQGIQKYDPNLCEKCSEPNQKFKLYRSVYGSTTHYITIDGIKKALYLYGPMSASIATDPAFASYRGGIYKSSLKGKIEAGNHAVELIGWGEEEGIPYWIILNQYGTFWGENGTMRIRMGTNEGLIESFIYGATPLIED